MRAPFNAGLLLSLFSAGILGKGHGLSADEAYLTMLNKSIPYRALIFAALFALLLIVGVDRRLFNHPQVEVAGSACRLDGVLIQPCRLPFSLQVSPGRHTWAADLEFPAGPAQRYILLSSAARSIFFLDGGREIVRQGHVGRALWPGIFIRVAESRAPRPASLAVNFEGAGSLQLQIKSELSDSAYRRVVWLTLGGLGLAAVLMGALLFKHSAGLTFVFALGVVLRVLYVGATAPEARSHDFRAHTQYSLFMAESEQASVVRRCSVCYHPPLYYLLNGAIIRALHGHSVPTRMLVFDLQAVALILSVILLGVALKTGEEIFGRRKFSSHMALYSLFIAVFPGLILMSSRANNDVLLTLMVALALYGILRWRRAPKGNFWLYVTALAMALGFLTKTSMAVMLPVCLVPLVIRNGLPWRAKFAQWAGGLVLAVGVYASALWAMRHIVGNIAAYPNMKVNPQLHVPGGISEFLTFNFLEILRHPYNNSWAAGARREFFWEFFFRSAFFGEFSFAHSFPPEAAAALLSAGWLLCLLAAAGAVRALYRRDLFAAPPLFCLLLCAPAALLFFRWREALACAQDFRYIAVVAIPWAAFAAWGMRALPPAVKPLGVGLGVVFILLCIGFVGAVALSGVA